VMRSRSKPRRGCGAGRALRRGALTNAIRPHAREVTGFVVEGMQAMMRDMMGNGMMRSARS
jgi:hypothetical protein